MSCRGASSRMDRRVSSSPSGEPSAVNGIPRYCIITSPVNSGPLADQPVRLHVEGGAGAGVFEYLGSGQVAERGERYMALPLRLGGKSRGGDDLGARPAHGVAAAGVVEVGVGEDEVADRRLVGQAEIGHGGPHAVRAGRRVDGDESGAGLDE